MSKENEVHFEGKVALKALVIKDEKILLVKDPRGDEALWEIPGGRMNVKEDPKQALKREFLEEMGVEIVVHEVVHMAQFLQSSESATAFVIVFRASLADESKVFAPATDEVSEIQWFTKTELGDVKLYQEYRNAIDEYLGK